jgi:predicted neuraminidase
MKYRSLMTVLFAALLLRAELPPAVAQLPGGFSGVSERDEQTVAAAQFAVAARDPHLKFEGIDAAERQVVAGLNYRLTLRVSENGRARRANAVVWRKLDGKHALTSWKWLDGSAAQAGLLRSEFIYDAAPFPSCHATTIVETSGGTLVAAWFGGTAEGKPDVGIWSSRLQDGRWTPPVEVANGVQDDGKRFPCWNPVLFQPREGGLMLFYKVGPSPREWWGMVRTSLDDGKTWNAATRLPERILGPVKNKPVQLADGTIVCGSSTEGLTPPPAWQIHFERSTDNGRTWKFIRVPQPEDSPAAIQPSVLLLGGGRLMALGRTRSGRIFSTTSEDSGMTWSQPSLLELPNPNSGTDAVTLKDGRHLLIYNHTERGRSPLNLAVSRDGKSWDAALVLEDEPRMEFSYPAIIQSNDGLVHVTYTWKRKKVRHVVIDPAKLEARRIVGGEWPK